MVVSRKKSDIYILNQPIEGSTIFPVEAGESRIPPEATIYFLEWFGLERRVTTVSVY